MLGGLELRRVGRVEDEADAVRNREARRRVPAGIVELEHDDAVAPGADRRGEGASNAPKNDLLMPLETNHTVSPLVGATKAVT